MSPVRYSILAIGLVLATLGLLWPLALGPLDSRGRWAVIFGGAIAALNTAVAHALTRWATRRSTTAFLGAVLGGMLGRMALMITAVLVGVLGLELPRLPLATSLLSYFVLFLGLELFLVQRGARRPLGLAR